MRNKRRRGGRGKSHLLRKKARAAGGILKTKSEKTWCLVAALSVFLQNLMKTGFQTRKS